MFIIIMANENGFFCCLKVTSSCINSLKINSKHIHLEIGFKILFYFYLFRTSLRHMLEPANLTQLLVLHGFIPQFYIYTHIYIASG